MNEELFESARQWANHDPDTATSTRLLASLEAAEKGDEAALAEVTAALPKIGRASCRERV